MKIRVIILGIFCLIIASLFLHTKKRAVRYADIIIKNGIVVTMNVDDEIIDDGMIVIKNGTIIDTKRR